MTMIYFAASQSGNKQTLRELRHQIPARKTAKNPLLDVVPGLDLIPLRANDTCT